MDTEQQTTQPKTGFLAAAAPWADTFSKAVAGIVIALYASGFLTVSFYHSQFAFVSTNPFRPRVMAAGAWFFFFTAIPISIAYSFRLTTWRHLGRDAVGIWIGCLGLSSLLGNMMFDYTTSSSPFIHLPAWGWTVIVIVWLLFIALESAPVSSKLRLPEWVAITVSGLLTAAYTLNSLVSLFKDHTFDTSCLALWFFGIAFVALVEFKVRNRENLSYFAGWAKPIGLLLATLLLFSRYPYPHLKASLGGGTPMKVTVYFSKDSLLTPNKSAQAQLIEESDEGFYIVGLKESKAIFVPRSAVAMIYFSDNPAASPMLQNGNSVIWSPY